MKFSNPNVRKWAYVGQTALGTVLLVLVAFGLIDQSTSDQVTGSIDQLLGGLGGLALMAGGELARRHLTPKPAQIGPDGVAVITDALDAYTKTVAPRAVEAVQNSAAAAVEQARRDLEHRLSK